MKNQQQTTEILKRKSLTSFPTFEKNPFIPDIGVIPRKTRNVIISQNKNMAMLNTKTGEIDNENLFITKKFHVDKSDFIKIYASELRRLFALSKNSMKLFIYFLDILKYEDVVFFQYEDCEKITGISKASIYAGLAELTENGIIARSKNPIIYFINPSLFYKGDRLTLISEYQIKANKERETEIEEIKNFRQKLLTNNQENHE